jgi:ribosomal protein S18 acetylase RimI-like enzyme
MSIATILYKANTASAQEIGLHLDSCSEDFIPPLARRVDIHEYSRKIFDNAMTFEAWHDVELIGLVAAYFDDFRRCYLTNVSVRADFTGRGIATALVRNCIDYAKQRDVANIDLEVSDRSTLTILFYEKLGFEKAEMRGSSVLMKLCLNAKQQSGPNPE